MPATSSGSTLHQPASDPLPSTSGNSFFTPVEHAPSQEGHLHPFLAVPVGPGMTANATTPAMLSGSAPPWISGNATTSGASITGEYNATRPGLPPTTQTSLSPSSASVPTPGLLQSPQPLYASPSIQRGTDLVMGMFVKMSEARERLLEENSRLREENENRRIDSDNLREELRKIRAENELLREKSAAHLALMARAARNTSTPIAESEEDGVLLARPSPMPPSPQPRPVEASIAQRSSPAQCAELPRTHTSLSPSSNNDATTVDIGADIRIPAATTMLQERSADPASSQADSIKPQVSSMPMSCSTPSSSSPGPFSSNPSRGCASSKPTPYGSPRQSVPTSMQKDDLVPKEEIKEEIKEEDDMFVVGSFASPREENAITMKQEDVLGEIARVEESSRVDNPFRPKASRQSLHSSSRNGTRVGSMMNFKTAPIAALNRETGSRSKRKAEEREDGELSEPGPLSRSAASGSGAALHYPSAKPSAQSKAKKFKPAHKVPPWKTKWMKARSKRKAKSSSVEIALTQESPRSPISDSDDDEIPLLRPFFTPPASSSAAPRPTAPPAVAPNPVTFRSPNASSYDWGLTPTRYPFDSSAIETKAPNSVLSRGSQALSRMKARSQLEKPRYHQYIDLTVFKRWPISPIMRKEGAKEGPNPCSQEGKKA